MVPAAHLRLQLLAERQEPGLEAGQFEPLADRLREREPGLPVLFMSGYTHEAVLPRDHPDGGALLHKPFTAEALLRGVREALRRLAG